MKQAGNNTIPVEITPFIPLILRGWESSLILEKELAGKTELLGFSKN
jgi:hypothetical protein